jgi:hypothetical protein
MLLVDIGKLNLGREILQSVISDFDYESLEKHIDNDFTYLEYLMTIMHRWTE